MELADTIKLLNEALKRSATARLTRKRVPGLLRDLFL